MGMQYPEPYLDLYGWKGTLRLAIWHALWIHRNSQSRPSICRSLYQPFGRFERKKNQNTSQKLMFFLLNYPNDWNFTVNRLLKSTARQYQWRTNACEIYLILCQSEIGFDSKINEHCRPRTDLDFFFTQHFLFHETIDTMIEKKTGLPCTDHNRKIFCGTEAFLVWRINTINIFTLNLVETVFCVDQFYLEFFLLRFTAKLS